MNSEFIEELYNTLKERKKSARSKSYTAILINNPELLAKKIGEESSELIIDFIKKNKKGIVSESADLIYHLLVVWVSVGVHPKEIQYELSKRKNKSGLEEKESRGIKNEKNIWSK